MWKQLGIQQGGGTVQYHDDAPLAAIRNSITQPRQLRQP